MHNLTTFSDRRGILTTQTMHMREKAYSTMDEYLDAETGIPTGFYPTFLGLRLAENFELGTRSVSKRFTPTF